MTRFAMLGIVLSVTLLSCGGGGEDGDREAATSTPAEPAESSGVRPCGLLTAEEVTSVLPGHDEGFVAKSGGSLVEGVDSYQCSYSSADGDLFTVIVHVAVDDARFEEIEPSRSTARMIHPDTFREVSVGDGGWLSGQPDDLKLTAIHGHAVIELELLSEAASEKGDALARLGSAIAGRLD